MSHPPTQTKLVTEYTMVCDHPECRRRIGGLDGRPFVRTTTCKRHRPESGYIIQVKANEATR
jgi:hypothetical protein